MSSFFEELQKSSNVILCVHTIARPLKQKKYWSLNFIDGQVLIIFLESSKSTPFQFFLHPSVTCEILCLLFSSTTLNALLIIFIKNVQLFHIGKMLEDSRKTYVKGATTLLSSGFSICLWNSFVCRIWWTDTIHLLWS